MRKHKALFLAAAVLLWALGAGAASADPKPNGHNCMGQFARFFAPGQRDEVASVYANCGGSNGNHGGGGP